MSKVPVREAICQGIDEEMARDERVFVLGNPAACKISDFYYS
jgi:pyruvate/2-oxoglutarate/acetoin dehydrogenase E1 component